MTGDYQWAASNASMISKVSVTLSLTILTEGGCSTSAS